MKQPRRLQRRREKSCSTAAGGGAREARTPDLLRAKQALSQLSYGPRARLVGLGGLEPPTSPLSGVRSNRAELQTRSPGAAASRRTLPVPSGRQIKACVDVRRVVFLLFKEVIQPQIPLRLPCYDFTPVIDHTVVIALPKVRQTTSGAANFHGVTGGVYKARERIHRDIADSRLLAIPTSRSRVADFDPD